MKALRLRAKVWTLLAAVLTAGTLFGTCEVRVRNALISGSKSALFDLLGDVSSLPNIDLESVAEGGF